MINDEIDAAMVQSIHQIAQIMVKKTIAKFVESKQTLSRLRHIGVDYAQGYGIDKPEPLNTLISSLKAADKKYRIVPLIYLHSAVYFSTHLRITGLPMHQ